MAKEKLSLVDMVRNGEYLKVHPTCVESHRVAGFQVVTEGIELEPPQAGTVDTPPDGKPEEPPAGKPEEPPADGKKE